MSDFYEDDERQPARTAALERAEELERRAWDGADDVAYCVKWSGIHRNLAAALSAEGGEGGT